MAAARSTTAAPTLNARALTRVQSTKVCARSAVLLASLTPHMFSRRSLPPPGRPATASQPLRRHPSRVVAFGEHGTPPRLESEDAPNGSGAHHPGARHGSFLSFA